MDTRRADTAVGGARHRRGAGRASPADHAEDLRHRLLVVAALGAPVVVLTLLPVVQFDYWQWLALSLAAPVVTWGAWPVHREAHDDLRRAQSTTAVLVAVSAAVGFAWSAWLLFFGGAGGAGVRVGLGLGLARRDPGDAVYLAAVVMVVCAALAARWLDAAALADRHPPRHIDLRAGAGPTTIATAAATSSATMPIHLLARRRDTSAPDQSIGAGQIAEAAGPAVLVLGPAILGFWLAGSGDGATAAAYGTALVLLACPVGLGFARSFPFLLGGPRLRQLGVQLDDLAVLGAARRVDTIVVRKAGALTTGRLALVESDGRATLVVPSGSIRPTASRAVATLRGLGVEPVLLTATESRRVDDPVASAVGIDEVVNGVPVGRSDDAIARLQRDGRVVAVMGDHVQDVRALARADLGIAHQASGDILGVAHPSLDRTELWTAVDAIRLGRLLDHVVRTNTVLATAVTVVGWPLAASGRLGPAGLVVAMALSAGAVAANSWRVRRFRRLRPPAHVRGPASQGGRGGGGR